LFTNSAHPKRQPSHCRPSKLSDGALAELLTEAAEAEQTGARVVLDVYLRGERSAAITAFQGPRPQHPRRAR
jgi:hypothetical protein